MCLCGHVLTNMSAVTPPHMNFQQTVSVSSESTLTSCTTTNERTLVTSTMMVNIMNSRSGRFL